MKKTLAHGFACLMILALTHTAKASGPALDALDDVMTPDEIAKEAGQPADSDSSFEEDAGETARMMIIVDKSEKGTTDESQHLQVFLDGEPANIFKGADGQMTNTVKVSTGREKFETAKSGRQYVTTTPTGEFGIQSMELVHHSNTWDADMPHAMFFRGGVAIHATTASHFADLGKRASGGCVRLHPANATVLYKKVQEIGRENVLIIVKNPTSDSDS